MKKTVLVFGASGSIGRAITEALCQEHDVYVWVRGCTRVETLPAMDAVVWCQGVNCNDTIEDVSRYTEVVDANLNFIVHTMNALLHFQKIRQGTRLCIISSIWETVARVNKFSYTVSKAALGGLVRSVAIDLRPRNILVNSILPGPVDNEMTRAMLTASQMQSLPGCVDVQDIIELVNYLCFKNNSTTGQSIHVDLGFSIERTL